MGKPNTWAKATVKNELDEPIKMVTLKHRYDNDHYDERAWDVIEPEQKGATFKVGYWTGFGRTGYDYWRVSFELGGKVYTCKDNFYCFLTGDDEGKTVVCRIYKTGKKLKMQVQCPGSSSCTVSLTSKVAKPNTWATATVKNDLDRPIRFVTLKHRYDDDHYDEKSWSEIAAGATGDGFKVGYWTGFGRTGYDYWRVSFLLDDVFYTCKDSFYCFLTGEDEDKTVVCRLYADGDAAKMQVICPGSSDCTVSLTASVANPNTWAEATVKNDLNTPISDVVLSHRYDDDHYDVGIWPVLASGQTANPPFRVGYWTGFGRTGYDYWQVSFESAGRIWTCKDSFYCFLTNDDRNSTVVCRIFEDGDGRTMEVQCPGSSNCTVSLTSEEKSEAAGARPIYVIAHRCNDPEDIGRAVSQGANAVECDLRYDEASRQIFVNHDVAAGTSLLEWLNNANLIVDSYGDRFALIIFDLKFVAGRDPKVSAQVLREVREAIRQVLTVGSTPINVLFSISAYNMRDALTSVMNDLRANEGVAIDESDNASDVEEFFSENGVANCWYGNGIFTLGPKDVYQSIKKGAQLRDANKVLKKVYVWTLASKASIRKFIEKGRADGVMVNVPGVIGPLYGLEDALAVVSASGGARMAKRSDPAFAVHDLLLKPAV